MSDYIQTTLDYLEAARGYLVNRIGYMESESAERHQASRGLASIDEAIGYLKPLREVSAEGTGAGQSGCDHSPAPEPTTAAVESGPCIICLEITTTDGEEFLCGGCREKGWKR